jgi:hypothetical protein
VGEIEIQQAESGQNIKCATPFFNKKQDPKEKRKKRNNSKVEEGGV